MVSLPYLMEAQIWEVSVSLLFYLNPKKGILIFTNADEGYKVYEKLVVHYLGEKGQKIVDIETK
jgi:hypothetical protein